MNLLRHTLPILALLILLPVLGPADGARVFTLEHRRAEQLLPLLLPLKGEGVKLSGEGNRILARGSSRELKLLAELIDKLDRCVAQFLVQIKQSRGRLSTPAGGVTLGNGQTSAVQSLRIEEGTRGFLAVGRDEPFTRSRRVFAGDLLGVGEDLVYRRVSTGFWVEPRMAGKEVHLILTPWMQGVDPRAEHKTVEFQQASSSFRVPLGTWVNLSGGRLGQSPGGRAVLSYRAGTGEKLRKIWIKVDRIEEKF